MRIKKVLCLGCLSVWLMVSAAGCGEDMINEVTDDRNTTDDQNNNMDKTNQENKDGSLTDSVGEGMEDIGEDIKDMGDGKNTGNK